MQIIEKDTMTNIFIGIQGIKFNWVIRKVSSNKIKMDTQKVREIFIILNILLCIHFPFKPRETCTSLLVSALCTITYKFFVYFSCSNFLVAFASSITFYNWSKCTFCSDSQVYFNFISSSNLSFDLVTSVNSLEWSSDYDKSAIKGEFRILPSGDYIWKWFFGF